MYGYRITSRANHIFGGCLLALACTQVTAFTGGVTTYNNSPNNTSTVERAVTSPAKTPELDQTYQRTMRKAQTKVAAARALGGIFKTLSGVGLLITAAQLASDLNGIWIKRPDGTNALQVADPSVCTSAPCYEYSISAANVFGENKSVPFTASNSGACAAMATALLAGPYSYVVLSCGTTQASFRSDAANHTAFGNVVRRLVEPSSSGGTPLTLADAELEDALKAGTRIPQILDELDDKGVEIPWTGEEIEDMPQPLVLSPRTTTNPDGSKTIEQTTLTPSRGPDGKTVGWNRTTTTQQISAPDAQGNTTTTTTTSTSNGGPSEPVKDDRAECEKSPNTLGCADLDTPSLELPKETKNVTFSLESISWGASASCPPPWPINIPMVNKSFQMSYESFCDVATRIKPFILAGAAFVAMLIVMAGIRS